jgi:hypothetical protein
MVNIINRDMTPEEQEARELAQQLIVEEAEAIEAARQSAIAKLEALGLTAEEVQAVFGIQA